MAPQGTFSYAISTPKSVLERDQINSQPEAPCCNHRREGSGAVLDISYLLEGQDTLRTMLEGSRRSGEGVLVSDVQALLPRAAVALEQLRPADIVLTSRDRGTGVFFATRLDGPTIHKDANCVLILRPSGLLDAGYCLPDEAWDVHQKYGIEAYYNLDTDFLSAASFHACMVPTHSTQYTEVDLSRPARRKGGADWLLVYFCDTYFDLYQEEMGPGSTVYKNEGGAAVEQLLWVPGPFYESPGIRSSPGVAKWLSVAALLCGVISALFVFEQQGRPGMSSGHIHIRPSVNRVSSHKITRR